MIGIIATLTLRQLVGRGRTLVMAVLAALPVLLAVVYRLGGEDGDRQEWAATILLDGLIVTTLLPLVALVYGTAAIGAEIDDGTAVYLLTKPVSRTRIMLAKLLASWLLTAATVLVSGLGAAAIALAGTSQGGILPAFAVALVVGSLVYTALFLMLSVRTSRALIAGLVYVFVWEGVVNGLFAGTRLLSVRHATLAVADALLDLPDSVFEAPLGIVPALILLVLLGAVSTWYGIRRLERFEIGESS